MRRRSYEVRSEEQYLDAIQDLKVTKDMPQMFARTFLGTTASVPSTERNRPGPLLEAGDRRVLVDCGEGTQRQLLRAGAGAGFRRLDRLSTFSRDGERRMGTSS